MVRSRPRTNTPPRTLQPFDAVADARSSLIESVRGLAAISVALFHFNVVHSPAPDLYHQGVKLGWLGVPAFFVISGYCIAHARMRDAIVPFWGRRLLRIYPPLWGSLAVIAAVIGCRRVFAGVNDITVLPTDPASFFYTLAGLTAPASTVPGMNWVYWTSGTKSPSTSSLES